MRNQTDRVAELEGELAESIRGFVHQCGWLVFLWSLMCCNILLDAYVLTALWTWFVASAFALPALDLKTAVGITLIGALITFQLPPYGAPFPDNPAKARRALMTMVASSFVLGLGWVAHAVLGAWS